jgi:trehalose 6-phosphate phosphatase
MPPGGNEQDAVRARIEQAGRLWLFLDYDGTLADFAPTPDHVQPDPALLDLLATLAEQPRIRLAIISGRRLSHVRKLVPLRGIMLAGTYGIELQTAAGEQQDRLDYHTIRPVLDTLKPRWVGLLQGREGFYLEDKGWTLAIHARYADDMIIGEVLARARLAAWSAIATEGADRFRLLGGHKFLEIGPVLAHKGRTVEYLLERWAWPGALPLYLGDDDKDEEAFAVTKEHGGIAVLVSPEPKDSKADLRLDSPQVARRWLKAVVSLLNAGS